MKFKFFLIVIAAVMSACIEIPVDVQPHGGGHAIYFEEISTKTLLSDANLGGFRVWGEITPGSADVFDGVNVIGKNPDETGKMTEWSSETERFWQFNSTYKFYAIAPCDRILSYSDGDYCFSYTMPNAMVTDLAADAGHVDIIVASATRTTDYLETAPEPVSLLFSHALSKISIRLTKSAENDTQTITVRNIYLRGMKGSGTYSFASGWETAGENVTASILDVSDITFPVNESREYVLSILAIPQELSADQVYLIVEYTYTHGESTSTKTLNVALPVNAVSEWKAGDNVTYSAVIHVDQHIQIATPVVEPWGSEQQGGVIIIR